MDNCEIIDALVRSMREEEKVDTTSHKQKKRLNPYLFFGIMAILAIIFLITFKSVSLFPINWFLIALFVVLIIVAGMFYLTKTIKKPNNCYYVRGANIVLSVFFLALSILLPYVEAKITSTIQSASSTVVDNTIKVNLYVMSDEYKANHKDIFKDFNNTKTFANEEEELKSYKDSMFISQLGVDLENQRIAIDTVKSILNVQKLDMIDASSIQNGAEDLYSNNGQVLFLSETNVKMLTGMEEYESFESDTRVIYSIDVKAVNPEVKASSELTKEPFALFFGGNDEEGELKLFGKTDVDMVVVVNPKTYQIIMVSFPRDSYVPNPNAYEYADKLTHLGVAGIDNTLTSLSNLLGVEINNYVLLNFTTYMKIIDALGGVDVDNPYEFGFWDNPDINFPEGRIHLDSYNALLYVRERKTLPNGDFDRTMHQQLVMRAIIEKIASPAIITKFDSLMTAMEGTFLTNLNEDAIYGLCQYQLQNNIKWNIINYRIEGSVGMAYCAFAPGKPLSVVYPSSDQIAFVSGEIKKVIDGEIISQEENVPPYGKLYIQEIQPAPSEMPAEEEAVEVEIETITPTPAPTIEPTVEPMPEPTVEPTPEIVEPTPTPEVIEPTVEPTVEPTPEIVEPEPTIEPTPEPTPEEAPVEEVPVEETPQETEGTEG